MKPGDKVRLLHSKGEGIVRKLIDHKTVEVEIEDGFLVPYLKNELVVVSSDESNVSDQTDGSSPYGSYSGSGNFWIAFVPFNDRVFSLYLLNDSDDTFLFGLGEEIDGGYSGVASGVLKPGTSLKISELPISDFEKWPEFVIQAIRFHMGPSPLNEPLNRRLKFKANSFFKSKQTVPVLQKEGHAFKIDTSNIKVDPNKVMENMFKGTTEESPAKISRPPQEVDLHIEKLVTNHSKMSNSEMLKIQLQTFEKNLDNAIVTNMEEIIFIHGVGNGVLRQEIHKALSKNKNIKFYQDARKEKFGYGATLVRLK